MPRIAFVGAGSVVFTKNLLSDLLSFPDLEDLTVVLHDIDPERLAVIEAVARSLDEQTGSRAKIHSTELLTDAVTGADYVVNAVAVGGYPAVQRDFDVPALFGIRQTIGDTLGIGGIFRAVRTIPFMVELGRELARSTSDALLLSYSNPMTMIPRAVYEGAGYPHVVGLCHSVRDTQRRVAELVGRRVEEVGFLTAGVNHQAWVLSARHEGHDLLPELRSRVESDPELQRTVRGELLRSFGYYPTESSEHGSEYVPWFLHLDSEVERYRIPVGVYVQWCADLHDTYVQTRDAVLAGAAIPVEPTSELASEVIHSIETGTPRTVHGNVHNQGVITNLPADACVEVPCLVDRGGVQPTRIGALPPQLAALNSRVLEVGDLVLRAVLEGRRDHLYQAAALDPATSATLSLGTIRQLVDTMIEEHGELIPEGLRRG